MKRNTYVVDGAIAKTLVRQQGFTLIGLCRALHMSDSWLNKALDAGRLHEDDYKALQECGLDLTAAVIKAPANNYLQKTDLGRIIRVINRRYKGVPYWVIADEEGVDYKTVLRYTSTWKHNRFNIEKEDLEELLRNWDKEDETAFTESTDGPRRPYGNG